MTSLEVLILQGRSQAHNGSDYVIGGKVKEPVIGNWTRGYHQGKYYSNTNDFHGTIPSEIGNLSNLIVLEISNAPNIVGPIPPEIGNLFNLKGLYLSGDDFRGETIPESFCNLTSLKHIHMEGVGLVGEMPACF